MTDPQPPRPHDTQEPQPASSAPEEPQSVGQGLRPPYEGQEATGAAVGDVARGYGVWEVGGAPLSSAGKRLGAYLLDGFVLAPVTLFIGWVIWSLIVWSKGQSPAKQLLGMRCVRLETARAATWGTMALRELVGKLLLGAITGGITTLISAFMILGTRRQGIWDKIANTTVVDDPDGRLLGGIAPAAPPAGQ